VLKPLTQLPADEGINTNHNRDCFELFNCDVATMCRCWCRYIALISLRARVLCSINTKYVCPAVQFSRLLLLNCTIIIYENTKHPQNRQSSSSLFSLRLFLPSSATSLFGRPPANTPPLLG